MKLSYQLYKNSDGTWRAEIPFPGRKNGISVHNTGEKDRARAERSAKRRCHRLPIEDRAHKRHAEKRKKGIPIEASGFGKPGRPRKVPLPPAPPAIDATVTAAKLRALPVDSGAGPVEPDVPAPPPVPGSAPEPSPSEPPPEPLPPLPDAAPPEPITPDVGDDRDPDAEGNEFFADVAATAVVAGTIKVCHSWAEKRGKRANEPSPKAIEWYTEGLQFRFRQLMGSAALTPTTKLLVGAGGVILSMLWGAPDLPESGRAPRNGESRQAAAAPPAPSDDSAAAGPDVGQEHWQEPAPLAIRNGHGDAAAGKFR